YDRYEIYRSQSDCGQCDHSHEHYAKSIQSDDFIMKRRTDDDAVGEADERQRKYYGADDDDNIQKCSHGLPTSCISFSKPFLIVAISLSTSSALMPWI